LYSRKYVQSRVTTITADKDSADSDTKDSSGDDSRQQNDEFPNSNDDDARR
jgi:hypothetical protein